MASYSLILMILLLCIVNTDGHRHSQKHRIRQLWDKIKDKIKDNTVNKFHIDTRLFDKEEMLLFPDVAFQSSDNANSWKVMVHGWRYENDKKKDWFGFSASRWVERIAKNLISTGDLLYLNGSINRDRLKPFFVDDDSNEMVNVKIGEKAQSLRTDQYGQFYEAVEVTNEQIQKLKQQQQYGGAFITYEAIGDNHDKSNGVIRLMEPRQGVSVISDIDDTIKISEVLDKVRLLANTFIHPFKPVAGMADLYQQWQSKNPTCTFHYLSGMPDQLYTLTQEFINSNNFPDGSFHMRHFGWALTSLFDFLHSESTFTHKIKYLRFFFSSTIRDYVLVGDSGEKDPEIYGTIAREYPTRVRAIFIRAIKGEAFDDARFSAAFTGVLPEKWQIFNNASQVPADISRAPKATAG